MFQKSSKGLILDKAFFVLFLKIVFFLNLGTDSTQAQDRYYQEPLTEQKNDFLNFYLKTHQTGETLFVWIYFTDKGFRTESDFLTHKRKVNLSPKTKKVRSRLRPLEHAVDFFDIPVEPDYLNQLSNFKVQTITASKWLNAVSAKITVSQLEAVSRLPFVYKIASLTKFKRPSLPPLAPPSVMPKKKQMIPYFLDYGDSQTQLEMVNLPLFHNYIIKKLKKNPGENTVIGVIDNGFNTNHEALSSAAIKARHDFIFDDANPQNENNLVPRAVLDTLIKPDTLPSDSIVFDTTIHETVVIDTIPDVADQDDHGTNVLSIIGGYTPGKIIGPAYAAAFLLAKTEDNRSETPSEEQYWLEAIEWMDSIGVDVVTTSLGYSIFDIGSIPDSLQYTPASMNGDLAVTTIAADIAASKGITVVAAAGNEQQNAWKIITAPADGDSVIAVGAVIKSGQLSSFSSVGPTADNRIKPDLVCLGEAVFLANSASLYGSNSYRNDAGTSYAAPQIAGIAALLLQLKPELTPIQVREALRLTASQSLTPDTFRGWGIVDAYRAYLRADSLLHGYVYSVSRHTQLARNQALKQVMVHLSGSSFSDSLFTDSLGFFEYKRPPNGLVFLQLSKAGFISSQETLQITNHFYYVEESLNYAANSILGELRVVETQADTSRPLPGQWIFIEGPAARDSDYTTSSGQFEFLDLLPGNYKLFVDFNRPAFRNFKRDTLRFSIKTDSLLNSSPALSYILEDTAFAIRLVGQQRGIAFYPNPFHPLSQSYSGIRVPPGSRIFIYSLRSELIWQSTPQSLIFKKQEYEIHHWQARNNYGNPVGPGIYLCYIQPPQPQPSSTIKIAVIR